MRSADRVQKCLLFGIDRAFRRHVLNDANDPNQTLGDPIHSIVSSARVGSYT
jgi:hypothetical protein